MDVCVILVCPILRRVSVISSLREESLEVFKGVGSGLI